MKKITSVLLVAALLISMCIPYRLANADNSSNNNAEDTTNSTETLDTIYNETIEMTTISLNSTSTTLNVGDLFQLNATVLPENTTNKSIQWYSDDETIAKVNNEGVVKALNKGVTSIHAKSTTGDISATTTIEVVDITHTITYDYSTNGGTSLSNDSATYRVKSNENIDPSLTATKAGYSFVGWNIDKDAKVAMDNTIMPNRDITLYAIYKKTVYIDYYTYDDNYNFSNAINIYNNEDTAQITLNKYTNANSDIDKLFCGYVFNKDKKVYSENDYYRQLSSQNISISESVNTFKVYCVYKKTCNVNYRFYGPYKTKNKKDPTLYKKDTNSVYAVGKLINSAKVDFKVPDVKYNKGYIFTSWLDEKGKTHQVNKVFSTNKNATLVGMFEEIPVTSVDILTKNTTQYVDKTLQIKYKVCPKDANNHLNWYTDNDDIATVDENGLVTCKSPGVVNVYASSYDFDDKVASVTITVLDNSVDNLPQTGDGMFLFIIVLAIVSSIIGFLLLDLIEYKKRL